MPKEWANFLHLISIGYENKLWNKRCVCKTLPIFMVRETPFNGKVLHTYEIPNQSG